MRLGRILLIIIPIILSISYVSAVCDSGQIDINTATVEELDEIVYIGLARAEQIIVLRPFSSVEDMIRISGIGDVYLNSIKEQGLACVEEEKTKEEEIVEEKGAVEGSAEILVEIVTEESPPIEKELDVINLNPKVIKSGDDMENLNKNNYAIYGLVGFCVLLGVLFLLRKSRYKKNEFR